MSCTNLSSINFGDNIFHVASTAFRSCNSLTSVTIPSGVQHIGSQAFYLCTKLTDIHVAQDHPAYSSTDGVLCDKSQTEIITYPCAKSGDYTVPESIRTIGDSAFMSCSKLTAIEFPEKLNKIGRTAFHSCTSLQSIALPDSLKTLYLYTFYGCTQLKTAHLAHIENIGQQAFYQCPLTSLVLPETVSKINAQNFLCDNIQAVYCAAQVPPTLSSTNAFYFSTTQTQVDTLYVPWRSVEKYKASAEWTTRFAHIQGYTFNGHEVDNITETTVILKWEPDTAVTHYIINLYKTHDADTTLVVRYVIDGSGTLVDSTHFTAPIRPLRKDTTVSTDELYVLTMDDLNAGTSYQYTINGYNDTNECVYYVAGSFTTLPKDPIQDALPNNFTDSIRANRRRQKIFRDGQLLILTDDKAYAPSGIEVLQ